MPQLRASLQRDQIFTVIFTVNPRLTFYYCLYTQKNSLAEIFSHPLMVFSIYMLARCTAHRTLWHHPVSVPRFVCICFSILGSCATNRASFAITNSKQYGEFGGLPWFVGHGVECHLLCWVVLVKESLGELCKQAPHHLRCTTKQKKKQEEVQ